jgi:hypothetical protein
MRYNRSMIATTLPPAPEPWATVSPTDHGLLTVVASCRQQGRPPLAFLVAAVEAALQGTAAPSLLRAGQGG